MPSEPIVSGPVVNGAQPAPWSAPSFDLAARGYVMEEFLVEGEAARYALADGSTYDRDGRWTAVEAGRAPYRTRILLVRPERAADFNGTVLAVWLNVTAGFEYDTITSEEIFSGYAWAAVSAQRVGIEGFPEGFEYTGRQRPQEPLKRWDPERYGTLAHPGDEYSFDIFTQAGRALGSSKSTSPDPLGGLAAERVIATGQSQSALRLTAYLDAVHPLVDVFDGFLLTLTPGWAVPLEEPASMFEAQVRSDASAPTLIVNSEWEAIPMHSVRADDSDAFRFWEVAGASHAVADPATAVPRSDGRNDNPLSLTPVIAAAYRAMHAWLAHGTPPPSVPRLQFASETPPIIARDEFGNAVGGLRLPELAAPVAEYRGRDEQAETVLQSLYGWSRPFTKEELRSVYSSQEEFRDRYRAAIQALVDARLLLPADAKEMTARAGEMTIDLD